MNIDSILDSFVSESIRILGDELSGIYLHGSAAMGCYSPGRSDTDLITVIKTGITDDVKKQYMDMVTELHRRSGGRGIEMSVVTEKVCSPFVYPTPFELHFSQMHTAWYESDPDDYIAKMKGTDKDLAAHFTIIYHRGRSLRGKPVRDVFAEVPDECYLDSIRADVENAVSDIADEPVYYTLNLCRVLAYRKEHLVLSKDEGGKWGAEHLPDRYKPLVLSARAGYMNGEPLSADVTLLKEFAAFMLDSIMA